MNNPYTSVKDFIDDDGIDVGLLLPSGKLYYEYGANSHDDLAKSLGAPGSSMDDEYWNWLRKSNVIRVRKAGNTIAVQMDTQPGSAAQKSSLSKLISSFPDHYVDDYSMNNPVKSKQQIRYLLSSVSPLTEQQRKKLLSELHSHSITVDSRSNPSLAHYLDQLDGYMYNIKSGHDIVMNRRAMVKIADAVEQDEHLSDEQIEQFTNKYEQLMDEIWGMNRNPNKPDIRRVSEQIKSSYLRHGFHISDKEAVRLAKNAIRDDKLPDDDTDTDEAVPNPFNSRLYGELSRQAEIAKAEWLSAQAQYGPRDEETVQLKKRYEEVEKRAQRAWEQNRRNPVKLTPVLIGILALGALVMAHREHIV